MITAVWGWQRQALVEEKRDSDLGVSAGSTVTSCVNLEVYHLPEPPLPFL